MDTIKKISQETRALLENIPAGFLIFDEDYKVAFSNRNFSLFGITETEAEEGKDIRFGMFRKEFGVENELEKMKEGTPFEIELKAQTTTDGGEISLILKGVPLMNDEFSGGVLLLEDLKIVADSRKRGEEILSGSNAYIMDNALSLVLIFNRDFEILHSNGILTSKFPKEIKKQKSPKLSQVLGEEFSDLIISELPSLEKPRTHSVVSERELILNNETYRLRYTLVKLPQSKIYTAVYCLVFEDLTEIFHKIHMQQKAIEELEHYQALAEKLEFAVCIIDDKSLITHWNRGIETLLGYRKSEVYGKEFFRLTGLASTISPEALKSKLDNNNEYTVVTDFYTKLGDLKKIRFDFKYLAVDENIKQVSILAADVSREEESLTEMKLKLSSHSGLTAASSDPVCFYDENLKITYLNDEFAGFCSQGRDKILGEQIWRILSGKNLERNIRFAKEFFLKSKVNEPVTLVRRNEEDEERDCLLNVKGFETGLMKNWCLIIEDITELKRKSEELSVMKTIFTSSSDGIALESEGVIALANDSFASLFGFESGAEVVGRRIVDFISGEDQKEIVTKDDLFQGKSIARNKYSFPFDKKDGTQVYIEVVSNKTIVNDKEQVVLVARDITVEKIAEEKLKESEIRYRSLTENLDDFFWIAERESGRLKPTFYTSSVIKITGHDSEDLLSDTKNFFKLIHPDDFAHVKQKLKRFHLNYYKSTEEIEFRLINKHGNIVWVRSKMNAVREKKGVVQKLFGLVTDVSAQKRAEEVTKESTLNLQKLNETKDRFISIISHDLRTPFSSMLGFTDLLLSDEDLSEEEKRQYITYIADASKSMLTMVNSLLDWTRLQTGRINFEPDKVNLAELIDKSITSVRGYALTKSIDIINETPSEIYAFVDQGLVMQAINNLISNSMKFTKENGFIKISAKQSPLPRFIEVTVEDNGVGIKPENLSKIFKVDTKFTTVGTSGEKGTGLGLSLVHEIIIKHGGDIRVESEYGKGAKFNFTLPKASASILLIDDSNTDKILYSKLIRGIAADYNIITASNGKEGLELVLKYSPALIITDHIMPVMTGFEFIKEFNELDMHGKPPVIVLSADLKKNDGLIYNDLGVEYVFTKPVNLASFKSAVESCLKKLLT